MLQWVAHGTNTGAFPDGSPATGRKSRFREQASFRLREKEFVRTNPSLTG